MVPGISYCLFYRFQRPHGVENGDDGHAHIGEHRLPHIGRTGGAERQHQELDGQGEDNVLTDDGQGAPGDSNGVGKLGGLVIHQHDVGGLDGGIGAQAAHGDTDVGPGEHRGVVDAVAHEGQGPLGGNLTQQSLHTGHLVGGEELGVYLVQAQLLCH